MEVSYIATVIGHFYFGRLIFGEEYSLYGYHLFMYHMEYSAYDPDKLLFPLLATCQFNKHGFGGGIENVNPLCMLNLNDWFSKCFNILWFAFAILLVIDSLCLVLNICRILFLLSKVRNFQMFKKTFSDLSKTFFIEMIECNVDSAILSDFKSELKETY